MSMLRAFLIGLFLVVMLPVYAGAVVTGETAPDFTLTDSTGEEHSLSDFAGQYVVLEWFNHQCPFVRKHYDSGNMQQLQKTYADQGVVWLSIISSAPGKQGHCTPQEAQEVTAQEKASPTAVLLDESGDVGRLYEAKTTPHMYIINPDGNLIYQGAIDDIPSPNPADIEGSTNYVSLALNAALNGESVEVNTTKSYGCTVKY